MNEIKIKMILAQLMNVVSVIKADTSKTIKLTEKMITMIS